MKGKHKIVVSTKRLKYEFELHRNLTIIRGDSATGKTTLVDALLRTGGMIRKNQDVVERVIVIKHAMCWREAYGKHSYRRFQMVSYS